MMREATEKCPSPRTAHAMRAAAIRLARERAGQGTDPSLAYGCVDWFRYDATSVQEPDLTPPPVTVQARGWNGGTSRH